MKYADMAESAFAFLRGTCHLFWQDWPRESSLDAAPLAWISGDLHLENFGSYRGDNGLTYFDINDFDEAALAPCTWDVVRLLTSVLVASRDLRCPKRQLPRLGEAFVGAYAAALAEGHARWIERRTATGMVRDLLTGRGNRRGRSLWKKRTIVKKGRRSILIDGVHALPATRVERQKVEQLVARHVRGPEWPRFWRVINVARRVSGLGSLGVE